MSEIQDMEVDYFENNFRQFVMFPQLGRTVEHRWEVCKCSATCVVELCSKCGQIYTWDEPMDDCEG